jgi:hypothetical protein
MFNKYIYIYIYIKFTIVLGLESRVVTLKVVFLGVAMESLLYDEEVWSG